MSWMITPYLPLAWLTLTVGLTFGAMGKPLALFDRVFVPVYVVLMLLAACGLGITLRTARVRKSQALKLASLPGGACFVLAAIPWIMWSVMYFAP